MCVCVCVCVCVHVCVRMNLCVNACARMHQSDLCVSTHESWYVCVLGGGGVAHI